MKKFILLFGLFAFVATAGLQAQAPQSSAEKTSCCKKSVHAVDKDTEKAAAKLASMDDSITKNVCSKSGHINYYRTVQADDGSKSRVMVAYNAETGVFDEVPEAQAKACCTQGPNCCKAKSAKSSDAGTPGPEKAKMN